MGSRPELAAHICQSENRSSGKLEKLGKVDWIAEEEVYLTDEKVYIGLANAQSQ